MIPENVTLSGWEKALETVPEQIHHQPTLVSGGYCAPPNNAQAPWKQNTESVVKLPLFMDQLSPLDMRIIADALEAAKFGFEETHETLTERQIAYLDELAYLVALFKERC